MINESPEPKKPRIKFRSVELRFRHDGWTPEKQEEFIGALADTGCVEDACRHVGMSVQSAYALRRRIDAMEFRSAWEAALDIGISRLSDAALSRAIHGVPMPLMYKGERVGEYRRYDERLTMWLLRYRDPVRYGKWLDRTKAQRNPQGAAVTLWESVLRMLDEAFGLASRPIFSRPRPASADDDSGEDVA